VTAVTKPNYRLLEDRVNNNINSTKKRIKKMNGFRHKIKKTLNKLSIKDRLIDKSYDDQHKKDVFIAYLKEFLERISGKLEDMEGVVFGLCLEKPIISALNMKSRLDLLEFVRESEMLGFKDTPRRITVVDQGERKAWNSLQKNQLKPLSCYVHAHMADDYIYLKLHQIVDITESNNGIPDSASIFIKDAYLVIKDTYEQVGELIWCHIQSLDDKEKREFIYSNANYSIDYARDYATFKKKIGEFIKNKVKTQIIKRKYFLIVV
jgi:hypothetical protein